MVSGSIASAKLINYANKTDATTLPRVVQLWNSLPPEGTEAEQQPIRGGLGALHVILIKKTMGDHALIM